MSKYFRGSYSIIIFLGIMAFSIILPPASYAQEAIHLEVPHLSQHFTSPDANGDTGYYDCAIAASAMALQAISLERSDLIPTDVSYTSVRRNVRSVHTDIGKGINLLDASYLIANLTNDSVRGAFVDIGELSWKSEVGRQLRAGFPIIAHIEDWRYLPGHGGKNSAAHAIVITGIDSASVSYIDPWNGREYLVPHDAFEAAWSVGYHRWYGIVFYENRKALNFTELTRYRIVASRYRS